MLTRRKINHKTVEIVLNWEEANCISWEATLPSGERITSGITGDDYDDLVEAIPEIVDMIEISMDIASGDYEDPSILNSGDFRAAQPSSAPKFLTIPEVAETLQVSLRTVYRWMSDGLLPVVRIGKVTRIQQTDLNAFLQAHRSSTPTSQEASL